MVPLCNPWLPESAFIWPVTRGRPIRCAASSRLGSATCTRRLCPRTSRRFCYGSRQTVRSSACRFPTAADCGAPPN